MSTRTNHSVMIPLLLAGCALLPRPVAASPGHSSTDWSELQYRAQKLFLSATTTISVRSEARAKVLPALRTPPEGRGIAPPGPRVTVITLESTLPFGRREVATAWIDPGTGQVLQTEKRNLGRDLVWKLRRYTADGVYSWRSEPRSPKEEEQEPASWSGTDNAFTAWPEQPPPGAVVTDSYALLYLISAARLDRAGQSLTIYLLSRDRLVEVRFTAADLAAEQVHFQEVRESGSRERIEGVLVRRVTSTARPLGDGTGDVDVGLMGLKDDVSFAIEVGTGLPVEISGRASGVGRVRVKLKRVVFTGPVEAPQESNAMPSPPPRPTVPPTTKPDPEPTLTTGNTPVAAPSSPAAGGG